MRAQAERELAGLGDARLGEWHEWTGRAYHIRRRLSEIEAQAVGPVLDVRRTPEAVRRAERVRKWAGQMPPEALMDEIGRTRI